MRKIFREDEVYQVLFKPYFLEAKKAFCALICPNNILEGQSVYTQTEGNLNLLESLERQLESSAV